MLPTTRRTAIAAGLAGFVDLKFGGRAFAADEGMHGIAMHGEPMHGEGFQHFGYVNPDAPKGGRLRLESRGTFDSFNGFIVKGTVASGTGLIYDTLLTQSPEEAFTLYGNIAESLELPEDRSWVRFNLRDGIKWHDGQELSVADILFSFETLTTKGLPLYRSYYGNVDKVEQTGDRQVSFIFKPGPNRELPLILGEMAVLPKHFYETREFDQSSLDIPLGSGPYRIKRFEAGRYVEYERVLDYWGADLPTHRGRHNFDILRYDYFRDRDVSLEAFKAGDFDYFAENSSKRWATGYDIPQIADGRIVKEEVPDTSSSVMQGYVMNLRRPIFADPRVRQAMSFAFDFEWMNDNLFYGQYERCYSYFSGSEAFAATELPDAGELALLEPFRGQVPEEVFTTVYKPPVSDASGSDRRMLRQGLRLLTEAGFELDGEVMTNKSSGVRLEFEYLYLDPSSERIATPFAQNLMKMGIKINARRVDTSQYVERMQNFDFDLATMVWGQSLSPGNEQRNYWGTAAADQPGSRNFGGIKDPVIDALIENVIEAHSREELATACRAMDRVLLWGHYLVPQFFNRVDRIAHWSHVKRPETVPLRGLDLFSWWIDQDRAREIGRA